MSISPRDWPRVRVVFEHALTLSVLERSFYVAEACRDSADVRSQVERMLASHERASQFLETPVAVSLADVASPLNLDGTQIGPYQLGTRIGAGGMGEVYSARDIRLGRSVAIKVLPTYIVNDSRAHDRFDREARLIATLNHPHICVLHDIGEATVALSRPPNSRDGVTVRYLVMELLNGETLAVRVTRGPLPIGDVLQYAAEIASALDRAHRAGIVHRDLKPSNIFLVPTGEVSPAFTAKLLDFGLAKQQGAPNGIDELAAVSDEVIPTADLTARGLTVGTARYMAPEQSEGRETDPRTDIFAFGLVLFEMLTGRKAFEGDDSEPARLSEVQPSSPEWLQNLVERCLARNPNERWQSAREILLQLQASHPLWPGEAGATRLAKKSSGRHSSHDRASDGRSVAIGAIAALVVAAAIAILGGRDWLARDTGTAKVTSAASEIPSLVVLPIRSIDAQEGTAAQLGAGLADAVATKLANLRAIRVRPSSAAASLQGRAIDAATVARQLHVDHVLTGTLRRNGDGYRFNLQLIRGSDDVLVWGRQIDADEQSLSSVEDEVSGEVVAALELQITGQERERLTQASTRYPEAYGEYLQGRALLANYSDSNLREAMNRFERALKIDPDYALAHAGLATAAGTFSVRFAYEQQAGDWGRRAEESAARALRLDANLAEAHLALASAAGTLYRNFDWATVIREAQVALTLNRNLDLAHSALARAYYHLGLLDLSEQESQRAEELAAGTNVEVSRVHLYDRLLTGHFDEARQMADSLMKRSNTVPVIQQYSGLAAFYLGDFARARDVLAGVRRADGRPDTRSQASLAGVLAASGRRVDAERTVREVLQSGYMDHHVAYALGAAEAQLGDPARAVKWLRTATETGFPCYEWMQRDSLLDPIRSDAAFQSFTTAVRTDYDRARMRYGAATGSPQ